MQHLHLVGLNAVGLNAVGLNAVGLTAFALTAPLAAQSVKLNAPLVRAPSPGAGHLYDFLFSADGLWTVYRAGLPDGSEADLFAAPLDGSAPARQINGSASGSESVWPFNASYHIAPDGTWVAYVGDERAADNFELYRVPIDGSAAPLALALVPSADRLVTGFEISPDGAWVVFVADLDVDDQFELFSVPADGSAAPVRLNGTLVPDGDVFLIDFTRILISPDSSRVCYIATQDDAQARELYSVPIDGSAAPVKLHAAFPAGRDVIDARIDPTGQRVVFQADANANDRYEVFSVPLDGSAPPITLNGVLPAGGDAGTAALSPDGTRVLYVADQLLDERLELFSVPIDGSSAAVRLNGTIAGDVYDAHLSPDGSRVVFVADATANRFELFSAPIDGSAAAVRLNAPLVTDGDVGGSFGSTAFLADAFRISPDGARVLYFADQEVDARGELYMVSIAGGPVVKVSGTPLLGGRVQQGEFDFTADGSGVVFAASLASVGVLELWSAPADASSAPLRLSLPMTRDRDVLQPLLGGRMFAVAPGSTRVAYAADHTVDELPELWSAVVDASVPVHSLMEMLPPGPVVGDVASFAWSPDGKRVLYTADQYVDELRELYSVARTGGWPQVVLNAPLATDQDVQLDLEGVARPAPLHDRVLFRVARAIFPGYQESLQSVPLDGSASPVIVAGETEGLDVTSDGSQLVFAVSLNCPACPYGILYRAPIDASSAAVEIGGADFGQQVVYAPRITADDARVVFLGGDSSLDLFSVPLDGSALPIGLSNIVAGGGQVANFELTPDGMRAVYVGEQRQRFLFELFSVPVDGSRPPEHLSAPLFGAQDVDPLFLISPDGSRVVYRADQDTDEVYELWSAPIAGNPPPIRSSLGGSPHFGPLRLSGAMTAGGDVAPSTSIAPEFALSPDGSRVVYRADQDTDEVYELYSVPLDGSNVPVRLNAPFGPNQDVLSTAFWISPDSTRVVYVADQDADEVYELYSARLDGSSGPVRLSGPMVTGGDVSAPAAFRRAVQITPDSAQVLYAADQDQDDVLELFVAPLDGSATPRKVSGPMVTGGDVSLVSLSASQASYALSPDGSAVAYIADQDEDEVHELYLSFLQRGSRQAPVPGTLVQRGL